MDTVIEKVIPLTLDGQTGTIRFHLIVDDWAKPVRWDMKVLSKSEVLLSKSCVDTFVDKLFADTGYVTGCSGYADCKRKWYFSRIFHIYTDTVRVNDPRRKWLKTAKQSAIPGLSMPRLKKTAATEFWRDNATKDFLGIMFFFAPEGSESPFLAYMPKVNRFVIIWEGDD